MVMCWCVRQIANQSNMGGGGIADSWAESNDVLAQLWWGGLNHTRSNDRESLFIDGKTRGVKAELADSNDVLAQLGGGLHQHGGEDLAWNSN